MKEKQKNWFVNWFDSHYYHLLYQNRNYSEAEFFINNLNDYLQLPTNSCILDLACGKGRHAKQLNELGFDVLGIDLSAESIASASLLTNDTLNFDVGDMRELPYSNHFDGVFNLFTSFGYFQKDGDNIKVIESIHKSLKKDGLLVLDYLNVKKVQKKLPQKEVITRGDIDFNINKEVKNGFITKSIDFKDKGSSYHFQEFVKLFDLPSFQEILKKAGFEISATLGDYNLNPFDDQSSDRLILIAKKK